MCNIIMKKKVCGLCNKINYLSLGGDYVALAIASTERCERSLVHANTCMVMHYN